MILKLQLAISLLITTVIASDFEHFNEDEHKSGYGFSDQIADFGYDKEAIDSNQKHAASANLAEHSQNSENSNKLRDSGSTKHLDESSNREKDSKRKKYGFYDYHFVEPQYRVEKFFTNEQSARKFDEGEHNKNLESHHNDKDHEAKEDNHRFQEKERNSNGNKFDQSSSGNHGHKDSHDEHHNLVDNHSYKTSEDNQKLHEPFKNGHYVPLFAPY